MESKLKIKSCYYDKRQKGRPELDKRGENSDATSGSISILGNGAAIGNKIFPKEKEIHPYDVVWGEELKSHKK